jgi:uncharacterized protein YcaQ
MEAQTARQLAIERQRLNAWRSDVRGGQKAANGVARETLLEIARELGCLQLDPISAVARSHTLVMFSRAGPYDLRDLDALAYEERQLFEYWAHKASLVLTEDYPIHRRTMDEYGRTKSPWHRRIREWVDANRGLRDYILREIRRAGPLPSRYFQEHGLEPETWVSSGWTNDRNVSRMLDFLWIQGKIMVARRQGLQKYWDLAERVLPEWTPREKLSEREVVRRAVLKSLRALGVATARHIQLHFIEGRYPNLPAVLKEMEDEGLIERVGLRGEDGAPWKGIWYIHRHDMARVKELERGAFQGRTVLLSPFDNLIRDRARTEQLWNFEYRIEIYTPEPKRKFGYYVLPVLHDDRLIGRVDAQTDRTEGVLNIKAVYAEPDAPMTRRTGREVRRAINELAQFVGAERVRFGGRLPGAWA